MRRVADFPGTKQHQALLHRIVDLYQVDPRIRAVIVFGSLGRGSWDEHSDLDLDVIIADGVQIDTGEELVRLCASLADLGERAAVILPDGDEGDIVLESLAQLSIRYHPLSQTSPNIVDSMLVLSGSLDAAQIAAAGNAKRMEDAEPLNRLLDRCVRYAAVANVEVQRGHFWAASEILHRMRALLMDIHARAHGGFRSYQFFDTHADVGFQQRLGGALPAFDPPALQAAFLRTLEILENDLGYLSAGQLELTPAHKTVLERVRREVERKAV